MATVADIHSRRIPRREVRRVPSGGGNGSMPDPIEEAAQMRRDMIGAKMMQQSTDEIDADLEARRAETEARKAEAELKRAETQIKLEQLRSGNAPDQQGGQSSDVMALVANIIGTLQGQNANLQQQVSEIQQSVFAEAVGSLRAELSSIRQELMTRVEGSPNDGNVQTLAARIEEVKQAKEALDPFFGQVPQLTGASTDINTLLLMNRIQAEHEMRLAEFRATREDKDFDRQLELMKFNAERARSESLASALNQMAPAIMKGVEQLTKGVTIPSPAAASKAATTMPCQMEGCGGSVEIQPGQDIALCSICGQQYQVQGSPG